MPSRDAQSVTAANAAEVSLAGLKDERIDNITLMFVYCVNFVYYRGACSLSLIYNIKRSGSLLFQLWWRRACGSRWRVRRPSHRKRDLLYLFWGGGRVWRVWRDCVERHPLRRRAVLSAAGRALFRFQQVRLREAHGAGSVVRVDYQTTFWKRFAQERTLTSTESHSSAFWLSSGVSGSGFSGHSGVGSPGRPSSRSPGLA